MLLIVKDYELVFGVKDRDKKLVRNSEICPDIFSTNANKINPYLKLFPNNEINGNSLVLR